MRDLRTANSSVAAWLGAVKCRLELLILRDRIALEDEVNVVTRWVDQNRRGYRNRARVYG